MRILNRPMFRYGGPIKEGVMHGMRDGGRTIAGGHQIGTPMGNRTGFADPLTNPGYWTKLWGASKNLFNPFKKIKKVKKVVEKGIPKNLQGVFTQTGTSPGVTGSGAGQTFLKNLKSFSFPGSTKALGWAKKAKDVAFKYPKSTAVGSVYAGKPLYDLATGPGKKLVETVADVAVPDWLYNWETGRWFNPDDTDLKPGDKKILEKKKIEATRSGAQFEDTAPLITAEMREKIAKDAQNKRLKSYLDMMGYDSAKKTALSDALIDASALVQDATTEAGSLKKADWGRLINQAIQTTSKRLDKPEQIREAVGLMMTKGEIEKDIADAKGTALDIKEKAFVDRLGEVAGKRGALGKPSTLSEAVNATKGTDSKGDRTNQALRSYFDGYLTPTFKGKISKKKIDALGGEDVLEEGMEIALDNGVYQVSKSYIIVEGNKIIEADDVFSGD